MAQNQKFYKSRHTGKEIDDAIDSIGQIEKEIPTDINLTHSVIYSSIVLERDGTKIPGQKNLAKIPDWRQVVAGRDYPIPLSIMMAQGPVGGKFVVVDKQVYFPGNMYNTIMFCRNVGTVDSPVWRFFDVDKTIDTTDTQILLTDKSVKTVAGNSLHGTGDIPLTSIIPSSTDLTINSLTTTGDVTIQGNLSVSGTTTTVDTETLKVKDNIIVTNSDKTDLLNLSGLAINVNASNTFGIMYNPNTNTVDLGLGSIDADGKFTYNANEGLPLVIRDLNDTFTQDHLISWSTDKNKIVDSGIEKDKVKKVTEHIYQPVPNNGIARYAEKNTIYTQNGAYARAFEHNNNTYIVANNALYRLNSGVLTSLNSSLITTTIDPDTTEIANQQPVEVPGATYFLCSYRVKKTDNSYEIRLRKFDYSGQAVDSFVTIATNASFGLYEPYIVMTSATTGYVYYSKENSASNQDIAMKKITINSGTITAGSEQIVVSGTNQKADNGKTISNSRPGFSVITKLLDGSYLMLIESNVNVTQNDNPYVIQYIYIKDLNVLSTYAEPKTLLKASGQLINIPYVATTYDGRIVITYHSTENFYGETGDGLGVHKKIFNSIISANKVEYGQELNAYDFEMIPTLNTVRDQWSGGWGSVLCDDNKINLLYVYGSNTSSASNQIGFCITTISNSFILTEEDASVEVTNNSIMKRSTRGFSYTATPVNLDPTQQPTLTVNKAYVGNYVDKAISDAIQVIDLSKGN